MDDPRPLPAVRRRDLDLLLSERGVTRVRCVVGAEEAGNTVQRLLCEKAGLTNARARGLVAASGVRRNGAVVKRPDERVAPGDVVEARFDPTRKYRAPSTRLLRGTGFRIVHHDDDVVVVDKEAGVLTVPTPAVNDDSLVERLEAHYRERGFRARDLHVVHRIDRYTSGLVVFARTRLARETLRRAFASRSPERVYLAVAEGRLPADSGRLEHHLHEDRKTLKVRLARPGEPGRSAVCRWRVLERFRHATLVEVALVTGRRNQIRVQFASEGHPLVGDVAFGSASPWIPRTALHAHRLSFESPSGRHPATFVSEPPRDFRDLVRAMRRGEHPHRWGVSPRRGRGRRCT